MKDKYVEDEITELENNPAFDRVVLTGGFEKFLSDNAGNPNVDRLVQLLRTMHCSSCQLSAMLNIGTIGEAMIADPDWPGGVAEMIYANMSCIINLMLHIPWPTEHKKQFVRGAALLMEDMVDEIEVTAAKYGVLNKMKDGGNLDG